MNFHITQVLSQNGPASPALFCVLAGCAAATGHVLSQAAYPRTAHNSARAAAWLLISYASIILPVTILGATGALRPAPLAAFSLLILGAALFIYAKARRTAPHEPMPEAPSVMQNALPPWAVAPFAAIALAAGFTVLVWGVIAPPPPWDAFVYHLPFAADWLQHEAISLVTVPFGDQAGTYFPSNTELYFVWLMMPLRSEMLTSAAQFPFYAGSALLVYAIARELGRSRSAAGIAACLGLLLPGFMHQAAAAEVDVVFAALFLLCLLFLLRYLRTDEWRDAALSGLAGGLLAGTKYIGAPFVLLLALPAAAIMIQRRRWKHAALYILAGVCGGGYWYVRNWAVAGNPVFPMAISALGIEIFPGGYTRETMLHSVFRSQGARQWVAAMLGTTGAPLGVLLSAAVPAGLAAITLQRSESPWRALYAAALPAAIVALFAFAIPYNLESRFTYAAWLLACVCAAHVLDARQPAIRWAALGLCLVAAVGAVYANPFLKSHVSMLVQIWSEHFAPGQPEPMLRAMRPCAMLLGAGAAAAGLGAVLVRGAQGAAGKTTGIMILICGLGASLLAPFAGLANYRDYRHAYAQSFHLGHAWQYLEFYQSQAGPDPAVIAFTGTDLIFGLYGPALENHVVHAAVHAHPHWKFHDCVRALKQSGAYEVPTTDRIDFCRRGPDPQAWIRNLDALGVNFVIIARLHQNDRPHLDHDMYGFPIERTWAQARPDRFRLISQAQDFNPYVQIYKVQPAPGR